MNISYQWLKKKTVGHGWVSKTPSCVVGNVENEERVTRRERERFLHKGELSWVGGMEEEEEGLAMLITHLHHFSHSLSPPFTLHPPVSHQLPRSPSFLLDLLPMHFFS